MFCDRPFALLHAGLARTPPFIKRVAFGGGERLQFRCERGNFQRQRGFAEFGDAVAGERKARASDAVAGVDGKFHRDGEVRMAPLH